MTALLMKMSIYEAMGLVGVAFYLSSYAALQFGFIDGKKVSYPFLNFMAASCVLISLFENFNMPSMLVQISWITISLYGISKMLMVSKSHENQ